ncbi:MAG: hypothetical protein LHW61_00410 [Candidatus Cloacimonetes bacterium]|jgi:cell division protein FtsL|nr:hypothetical protein [Candidatus Cloacimonadota bacterium]
MKLKPFKTSLKKFSSKLKGKIVNLSKLPKQQWLLILSAILFITFLSFSIVCLYNIKELKVQISNFERNIDNLELHIDNLEYENGRLERKISSCEDEIS